MRISIMTLIAVLFALMIFGIMESNMTGYSVHENYEDSESIIKSFGSHRAFEYLGEGAIICFVVEEENRTSYYEFAKFGDEALIEERYCADNLQNNIIIKFNSREALVAAAENPNSFIKNQRNIGYYILPSNYVRIGGQLECTPEFQQRYCGAMYGIFGSDKDIAILPLPCCANYRFTPSGMAFGIGTATGFFLPLGVLLLVIIVLFVFSRKKKTKD